MENYAKDRKNKLSEYKTKNLTKKDGCWRNNKYGHILPLTEKELNILEPIRNEFWHYFDTTNIKLHQYFNHLNSSQALCFNMFFPLFYTDNIYLSYLLENIIEVDSDYEIAKSINNNGTAKYIGKQKSVCKIESNEFEKILEYKEKTNFDFYIKLQNGYKFLFEIKYTENKFGSTKNDENHFKKYKEIYLPKLVNLLKPEYCNETFVFQNYQIIRNLSYIDDLTSIIFIFPKKNNTFKDLKQTLSKILLQDKLSKIQILYIEDLIEQILANDFFKKIHPIYENFKTKYLN